MVGIYKLWPVDLHWNKQASREWKSTYGSSSSFGTRMIESIRVEIVELIIIPRVE